MDDAASTKKIGNASISSEKKTRKGKKTRPHFRRRVLYGKNREVKEKYERSGRGQSALPIGSEASINCTVTAEPSITRKRSQCLSAEVKHLPFFHT